MHRLLLLLTALAISVGPALVISGTARAASGSIYLSPATVNVKPGAEFKLSLRMTSDVEVGVVQASLIYPSDKLTFVKVSYDGSAFENQVPSSNSDGNIKLARFTITPVYGDQLIANVTFRAKAQPASAAVVVGPDSVLASEGAEVPSTKGNAAITIGGGAGTEGNPQASGTATPETSSGNGVEQPLTDNSTYSGSESAASDAIKATGRQTPWWWYAVPVILAAGLAGLFIYGRRQRK